jgi:hypothetical protein
MPGKRLDRPPSPDTAATALKDLFVSVRLTARETQYADSTALRWGITRSELMRRALRVLDLHPHLRARHQHRSPTSPISVPVNERDLAYATQLAAHLGVSLSMVFRQAVWALESLSARGLVRVAPVKPEQDPVTVLWGPSMRDDATLVFGAGMRPDGWSRDPPGV